MLYPFELRALDIHGLPLPDFHETCINPLYSLVTGPVTLTTLALLRLCLPPLQL